jgi:ankyrin repeat protein
LFDGVAVVGTKVCLLIVVVQGTTALMVAAQYGSVPVAEAVLKAGADVNAAGDGVCRMLHG